MNPPGDSDRVDRILDVLVRLAAGDLQARAEVTGTGDNVDALAAGINMLAEEIEARVTAVEHAAEELRRQVSERSRQLADALAAMSESEPQPVAVGEVVEQRYRVVRELGAGGMGTVHEVVRVTDGRRLALKTLRGRVDRGTMARFAREAQIATELTHPNLVPVLDLGVTPGGMMYLVMELIEGTTLEDERSHFGRPAWALPLLRQVATGIGAIHERGIIHRDLKPANVLVSRDGVARIADFGIASLRPDALPADGESKTMEARVQSPTLTAHGIVVGTPAYMAPELIRGARGARPAADVFSFGVLATEMLTGRMPFAEPPFASIALGRPIAWAPLEPAEGVPPPTMAVLRRCLHVAPDERPSAQEVREALSA
ncbi:MAG TPA: protein kinase [Polyangiaceae bacterium]